MRTYVYNLTEGYVFTGVCLSIGGFLADALLGQTLPQADTPRCMLEYGQQVGGTHPTGMHSCVIVFFSV